MASFRMTLYQATNEDFGHAIRWGAQGQTPYDLDHITLTAKDDTDTIVLQATENDYWSVDSNGVWSLNVPMGVMAAIPIGNYDYDIVAVRTSDGFVKNLQFGKLHMREGVT